MPYFTDHYGSISYPLPQEDQPGLYNAQLGAIHSLAAHYTVDDRSAIVTMPTGSGKTAVLMMLPFLLRSTRVLIITPSRLVRGQIAEDFSSLKTLREIGVLPFGIDLPRVKELKDRISTIDDWEALREYDVVVSTPNCVSPGYLFIPTPPDDLFDLVVIDEAHHSPAFTWASILQAFGAAHRALFTATPFRRDRAEIPGRFIYNYPITRAFHDHIFGPISYVQVEPREDEDPDVAIARTATEAFQADRAAGLSHRVMVRTDRKGRADHLAELYSRVTPLRLKVVHSDLSNRTVKGILDELEAGGLDGVICVNMMGEGFNFPRLKIAAVHSPHKSLEVTLQFIGRFARTNAPDIGEAKFIALLNDIEIERKRIFDEGAVWQEIIPQLSYGRIQEEIHTREVLEEFRFPAGAEEFADLSLYSLNPRSHVKIYDVTAPIDLRQITLTLGSDQELCYSNINDAGNVMVMITRSLAVPKWSAGDLMVNLGYDLIVLFHDPATGLLFINSSRSLDGVYEALKEQIAPGARPLATGQVGRVIKSIVNQRIFNIGMRNIHATNTRESYKIVAASDAQVDPADARRYRQGHVFLTGEEDGERTTIGYSSGGKVWSTANFQIPELLDWCRALAQKIRSTGAVVTHSGLDYLDAGEVVQEIPEHLIYVEWNKDAFDFTQPAHIEYVKDDGTTFRGHILDLELRLDRTQTNRDRIRIIVTGEGVEFPVEFGLADFYSAVQADADRITVTQGSWVTNLVDYLNESNLNFHTANGSLFTANEIFKPNEGAPAFDTGRVSEWNWGGVDIEGEITPRAGLQSIHQKLESELLKGHAPFILYDHGSGEIADFITIEEDGDAIVVSFYHCKGSGGANPGVRVDDVYEVCGQAQKSVAWASLARFAGRLRFRNPRFVRGNRAGLEDILERAKDRRLRFEIKIVQPGISKANLSPPMAECLGATTVHLTGVSIPLEVIASA